MIKRVLFYALTFAIPATLTYAILEYGVARFYYSNTSSISDKIFDPTVGWRLSEGDYWIKPPHSFSKHITSINRQGLRNKPISEHSNQDALRIIVLGDSFTFGQVIPEEKLFTTLLEYNLNREGLSLYEVVNAGIPGYGNAQELLLLKSLAEDNIVGDLYVLMLFTNDILDNQRLGHSDLRVNRVQPGFQLDSEGNLRLSHLPETTGAYQSDNFVAVTSEPMRTRTLQIITRNVESFFQTRPKLISLLGNLGISIEVPRMPGLINGWYRTDVLSVGVPLMRALIGEIAIEANNRGALIVVSLIPSPMQVYVDSYGELLRNSFPSSPEIEEWLNDQQRPQRITAEICAQIGLPFLDLYPILRANNEQNLYVPREGHLSESGHRIVADALAQFVEETVALH